MSCEPRGGHDGLGWVSSRVVLFATLTLGWVPSLLPQTVPPDPANLSQEKVPVDQQGNQDRGAAVPREDYRIGPSDVLEISIFETADLNRTVRVSANGEITLPPLGAVKIGGLTPRQTELTLEGMLRRTYVKNPHIAVFVKEMLSHPVFVFGMVGKPGMYHSRGSQSLLEILSEAGGVLEGAGDSVFVVRSANLHASTDRQDPDGTPSGEPHVGAADSEGASAQNQDEAPEPELRILRVSLKDLLEVGNPRADVPIFAGDVISIPPPRLVYVVGDVAKPGGYPMKNNESLWQLMALAGGPTGSAAKRKARIIRVNSNTGERSEIPVDLNKILLAKSPGPALEPNDIVYVPGSGGRHAMDRALSVALAATPGMVVAATGRF